MFEQLFSKGQVFAGRFVGIDHEKYFIIVGITENKVQCCSVFINSNIPNYIINKQTLLNLQVNIKGSKYDFLTHDSFVSCNSIKEHEISDLHKCRYIGKIDNDDLLNVTETIVNSGTLEQKAINKFFK
jgi:hypothetical protein